MIKPIDQRGEYWVDLRLNQMTKPEGDLLSLNSVG
jgi:hypothetical protein